MRATSTEGTPQRRPVPDHARDTRTLIDDYLAEQQRLQTPVRRFSDAHDRAALGSAEAIWRDLIPLTTPAPGEQYAFEVNLDQCTGCKACVAGCHSLNGLDDEETWRDVGLLLGGTRSQPFQQTITTACHHCEDPACLNGCPVLAYEKDPVTGIVRHLDDQCIGCQYCVLKCPYDVPKYSERLGIVRKCDMCHSRLNAGEAPACVQACPTQAIRIVTVATKCEASVSATYFPPVGAVRDYTSPTTRYVSSRELHSDAAAADAAALRPQPPHWPLVFMLTLTPMAVGSYALLALRGTLDPEFATIAWIAGLAGLASSIFHLGQPFRAWRVFLGLRKSWLSREAVVFGVWFALSTGLTLASWLFAAGHLERFQRLALPLTWTVAAFGGLGLFCSVMIYADTHRRFWRATQTGPRFFGTAVVLSAALGQALYPSAAYALVVAGAVLVKLAVETRCFHVLDSDDDAPTPAWHTAQLLSGPLRGATSLRYSSAILLVFVAAGMVATKTTAWLSVDLLALAIVSEVTERYLFFRAVFASKMPGVVST